MATVPRSALALAAATSVGIATMASNRSLATFAIIGAIALTLVAVFGSESRISMEPERLLQIMSGVAVAVGAFFLLVSAYDAFSDTWARWIAGFVAVAIVVASASVVSNRPRADVAWWSFVVLYAVLLWLVLATQTNSITTDVGLFQVDAVDAIFRGVNPYSITFLDLYDASSSTQFYGEGVSVDGILQFGFPYFPLSLLLVAPFEALFGDYRIAHAIAIVLSGVLIGQTSVANGSRVAGVVFLLLSPSFILVQGGWTDPLVALVGTATVYLAVRTPALNGFATGLLVAVKQYAVLVALPSLLLLPRPYTVGRVVSHYARAGAVFVVLTLPFVAWGPSHFYSSVVALQFVQPFRRDSIAIPAMFANQFESLPRLVSIGIPLLIVLGLSVIVVLKAPSGAQGFALGSALVLLTAFVLSKQAFDNYYLVPLAFLCSGAGAGGAQQSESDRKAMAAAVD
jgi:uncharacterized membrane protein